MFCIKCKTEQSELCDFRGPREAQLRGEKEEQGSARMFCIKCKTEQNELCDFRGPREAQLRGEKEEQGSARMFFIYEKRSKANFAPTWSG
jgi:hypothetical protein